jgi:flagellar protein FlaG
MSVAIASSVSSATVQGTTKVLETERAETPLAASGSNLPENGVSQGKALTGENLTQALDSIRSSAQALRRNLEFSLDEASGMTVVTVIASDSGEVIRQIPSEVLVKLAADFHEASNLLFSEQA